VVPFRWPFDALLVSWKRFLILSVLGLVRWFYGRRRERSNTGAFLLVAFGCLLCCVYILRKAYIFHWYVALAIVPISVGVLAITSLSDRRKSALGAVLALYPLDGGSRGRFWMARNSLHPKQFATILCASRKSEAIVAAEKFLPG
jgi:hypothetical protein